MKKLSNLIGQIRIYSLVDLLLLLIVIAGAVFLIVFFAFRPDLIENIWIWLIGLSGSIIKSFKLFVEFL